MPGGPAFDPEIVVRTANDKPVRAFQSFGHPVASTAFRVEVRQYEWKRSTESYGWSEDCAQLLMFAGRRPSPTSAYLVRGQGRTRAQDLGNVQLIPRGARLYSRCPPRTAKRRVGNTRF